MTYLMTIKKSLKTIFLFMLSIGFIIVGLSMVKEESILFFIGSRATGSIISYEYRRTYYGGSQTFAHPVVSFTTDTGEELTFTNPFSRGQKTYKDVTVYYNPANPQDAVIMNFVDLLVFPFAFILSGIFILVVMKLKLLQIVIKLHHITRAIRSFDSTQDPNFYPPLAEADFSFFLFMC